MCGKAYSWREQKAEISRPFTCGRMLPQTIMADSGAGMALFGLRTRTNVDLLFWNATRVEILGERNGTLVEAHGRNHFQIHGRTGDELFYDPSNFGCCHGMKFVSLPQMARYKTRRAIKGRDENDVAMINALLRGPHA